MHTVQQTTADLHGAKALAGKSGSLTETVDGESMNVYYAPLNAFPHLGGGRHDATIEEYSHHPQSQR